MAVESTMIALGTPAPAFELPDASGGVVRLADFDAAPALVVVFMCNHCPYVQRVAAGLAQLGTDLAERGVAMVGISSNDVASYPQDGPKEMAQEAARHGWTFPYLYDESPQVALAYSAGCTPGNEKPVTAADIRAAVDAVLAGTPAPADQIPAMGCGIKWKPGNEPGY